MKKGLSRSNFPLIQLNPFAIPRKPCKLSRDGSSQRPKGKIFCTCFFDNLNFPCLFVHKDYLERGEPLLLLLIFDYEVIVELVVIKFVDRAVGEGQLKWIVVEI